MIEKLPNESTPLHVISDDGLTLTTYALIDNEEHMSSVSWDDIATAEANYENAKFAAEHRLYINKTKMEVGSKANITTRNILGLKISFGSTSGNDYDEFALSFGRKKLTGDIINGKAKFSTAHWEKNSSESGFLMGFGGRRRAFYVRLERRK